MSIAPSLTRTVYLRSGWSYNTPPDIRIGQARDIIHRAQDRSTTERINTYKDVCTKVRPVMRHHFLDRHKDPRDWYKMRLNYTRSVATTSIVGHILGLGDRHGSNIMLDNSTGEHVHVDFGIAFDAVGSPAGRSDAS